MLIHCNRQHF